MTLGLKGTLQEYYYLLLFQLRAIPPYHTLQTRESELLSHLMALDYQLEYAGIGLEERGRVLASYDTKLVLMEELNISDSHYRNLLQMLRKKGFVTGKALSPKLRPLMMPQQIVINFTIQEEQRNGTENIQESVHQGAHGTQ